MRTPIDITGNKFTNWSVISRSEKTNNSGDVFWNCVCDCGTKSVVVGFALRRKTSQSCGCIKTLQSNTSGRQQDGEKTPEYRSWRHMKDRCLNKNDTAYRHYGGRGITICDRWLDSFDNFFADMGKRPHGLTLERKNVNGDYEPENCVWDTYKEQARNKRLNVRLTLNGFTMCVAEWAELIGISDGVIRDRIKMGWDTKSAILKPVRFLRKRRALHFKL